MLDKGTRYRDRLRSLDLWSLPSSVANSDDEGDSASHKSSDNEVAAEAHDAAHQHETDDVSLQSWPVKPQSVVESDTEPPKRKLPRISEEITHALMKDLDVRTQSVEGRLEKHSENNERLQKTIKALTRDMKTIKSALAIVEKKLDGSCPGIGDPVGERKVTRSKRPNQ
ncbi:uncharacterized protein N7443_001807 [Penicillium atrosanguineum]|uniref:Uncharacterized protein n=1 Tax=Penicillium atrosanguineum TaxID=1132637 RepID=A0A9W9PYK2_9EURO|nr:uncharacterized protein N7443_001807 [Penicillium atrosanguineum]KAJ5309346.1 hypothetical protein N7443_001807 [Penicillium atrosanguineum]KAJ5318559.1 hypothetical protein N7476_004979 [Penicillium atrosanguineum]